MKKRILSFVASLLAFSSMFGVSALGAEPADSKQIMVDGSYLTMDEMSTGHSASTAKGYYLMTGDCSITNAGLTRIYAYASTTANRTVKYIATIAYIDQYQVDEKEWWQIDGWVVEDHNDFYLSTDKTVTVDRGYYYRVRANHIAGNFYPYEETASVTDGIFVS